VQQREKASELASKLRTDGPSKQSHVGGLEDSVRITQWHVASDLSP